MKSHSSKDALQHLPAWRPLLSSRAIRCGLVTGGLIPFVLLFQYGHLYSEPINYIRQASISQETKANEAIHNSTLGVCSSSHLPNLPRPILQPNYNLLVICFFWFEKIFVVSLSERSDQRDGTTLQAAVSGISIEFIDGRKGQDIPDKALPYGVDREKFPLNSLGCWRGHMDAVQRYAFRNSPLLSPTLHPSSPLRS